MLTGYPTGGGSRPVDRYRYVSPNPAHKKTPVGHYRAFDTTVSLYEHDYRAIVVHSSAHDKRRQKRILRLLDEKHKQLRGHVKQAADANFFCHADAQSVAEKLQIQAN